MKHKEGMIVLASRDDGLYGDIQGIAGDDRLTIVRVEQGQDLLRRLAGLNGTPRVVILDEDLVDTRGRTLVGAIRSFDEEAKIIFIASSSDPGLELEVRRSGVYFFLTKPADGHVLRLLIERALSHETTRLLHRDRELVPQATKKAG